MELIVCFGFAVSAFILLIVGIVTVVNAPTPILLSVLVAGVILTQKSIDKLNEPSIIVEETDQDRIEKVETTSISTSTHHEDPELMKAMIYRGSNYQENHHKSHNVNSISNIDDKSTDNQAKKIVIQYRGVKSKVDSHSKKIV